MTSKNEKNLEKFEPENDNRSWTRHLKPIFIMCVIVAVILQIILVSVQKVGTLKSQSSEFSNPSFIEFSAKDLENLLEVKFFTNVSTASVQSNMDCYVNQNK